MVGGILFPFSKLRNFYHFINQLVRKVENYFSAFHDSPYIDILNFFDNRSTNASAESFNAKIKNFRAQLRGISDVKYFLFRLQKIYA